MKSSEKQYILCPNCEWEPYRTAHWQCTCGHEWNTFDTKGQCPRCDQTWEETTCLACGETATHADWYKSAEEYKTLFEGEDKELKVKRKHVRRKLGSYGFRDAGITDLPYLDHTNETYRPVTEAAERMMVLTAVASAAQEPRARKSYLDWLTSIGLEKALSPTERDFLTSRTIDQQTQNALSWNIEAALCLGWCLNLVPKLPGLREEGVEIFEAFYAKLPAAGQPMGDFMENLSYRNLGEIHEENIVNELITANLRDLYLHGQEPELSFNAGVSHERHRVLNWLRSHAGIEGWDETDTST
jgi:hypothetical protein